MKMEIVVVLLMLTSLSVSAETKPADAEVRETLSGFIQAFDNLEWEQFRNFFADDATVFNPRDVARRANGREEIEARFRTVFEQIRGNRTKPPYMDIQPRDLVIQIFGEVAIATFHLDDRPGVLNRRTVVMHKEAGGWKIVHLHASEVPLSRP